MTRRPLTFIEDQSISRKRVDEDTSATLEDPYPKILQDGAVEEFRPQEVNEKVTYADPLSPPDGPEVLLVSDGEDWNNVGFEPAEEKTVGSHQVESGLSQEPGGSSVPSIMSAEKHQLHQLHAPVDSWVEKQQGEASDSESEVEPTVESRMSRPASECEPEERVFSTVTGFNGDDELFKRDAGETRRETSMIGTNGTEIEDRLYPDGEEMDTWDSVMERKVDLEADDCLNEDVEEQYAEPEEDISGRKLEHSQKETKDSAPDVQPDGSMAYPRQDTRVDDRQRGELKHMLCPEDGKESDEEEDSQNVSMSWRSEPESDSYVQDNTLADTRPLIRYKSNETDANTQASHMDVSESSEGEQDKKVGETRGAAWSEDRSKTFGTMEDLCEEGEGETLDEEYDLIYTHTEDEDECGTLVRDEEDTEEMMKKVSEAHSDDEELEINRLVEQELENLSTDSYSSHFAQQQADDGEALRPLRDGSVKETLAGESEDEFRGRSDVPTAAAIVDQPLEDTDVSYLSAVTPQTDTVADEEEEEDQEAAPDKSEEEEEHNVSMVTHADATEGHIVFNEFISKPNMEEINSSESRLHRTEVEEVLPVDASSLSQEHVVGEVADHHAFPEVPETAEWEVLEKQREDFEIRDQDEGDEKCPNVSVKSFLHDEGADEGAVTPGEEPLEGNHILVVKDSTELSRTNGKGNSLHGLRAPDVWASSLETGATLQPYDAFDGAAGETNQSQGFGDDLDWGDSGSWNVVNGKSRVDRDPPHSPGKEQGGPSVQEESKVDGESSAEE